MATTATAPYRQAPRKKTASAVVYGTHAHGNVAFRAPRTEHVVKDLVWLSITSMALALIAVVAGLIDAFTGSDLLSFTLGAGLASITFSLLGMTDRLSGP